MSPEFAPPTENEGWSPEFPRVPGEYWFHGWHNVYRHRAAETRIVRVIRITNGKPEILDDGCNWLHEGEAAGLFRPYIRPTTPVIDRGACVMVLTDDGTRVLVSRRHDHVEAFAGMLQFPGGLVEDDESDEKAAMRELREETGLYVGSLHGRLDACWSGVKKGRPYSVTVHIFRTTQEPRQAEPEKNGPWFYMSVEEIIAGDQPCIPGMRESLIHAKKHNRLVRPPLPTEDCNAWA